MHTVNISEAKMHLSRLVAAIKSGIKTEIMITKNGVPVARLVPIRETTGIRWGHAKGKFAVPKDIDALNPEIESLFGGSVDR